MSKSVFTSEDPNYYGPERRKAERRTTVDRRQYIRIDDDKHKDRRQGEGRRDDDIHDHWYQHEI